MSLIASIIGSKHAFQRYFKPSDSSDCQKQALVNLLIELAKSLISFSRFSGHSTYDIDS